MNVTLHRPDSDPEGLDPDMVIRFCWPGTGGRSLTIQDLESVAAHDESWQTLTRLVADHQRADISNADLRELRAELDRLADAVDHLITDLRQEPAPRPTDDAVIASLLRARGVTP